MAEEMFLTVKSNISTVTKNVNDLTTALTAAEQEFANLNEQLFIQKTVIADLEIEYIKLQELAVATPRTASAGYPQLLEKIREVKSELGLERVALKKLNSERSKSKSSLKSLDKGYDKSSSGILSLADNIQFMGTSVGTVRGNLTKALPAIKKFFVGIKAGVASTGIGLLIVGLASLAAWFATTEKGAKTWEDAMTANDAATEVFSQRLEESISIMARLWSGAFLADMKGFKEDLALVGDELEAQIKKTVSLQEAQENLTNSERDLSVEIAQRQIVIDELNRAGQDETLTTEERIEKTVEANVQEKDLGVLRETNAIQHIQNIQQMIQLEGQLTEHIDSLATAEIALANIQRANANKLVANMKKVEGLEKAAESRRKSRYAAYVARENARIGQINSFLKQEGALIDAYNDSRTFDDQFREEKQLKRKLEARQKEINKIFDADAVSSSKRAGVEEKNAKRQRIAQALYDAEMLSIKKKFDKLDEEATEERIARNKEIEDAAAVQQISDLRKREDKEMELEKDAEIAKVIETKTAQEEDLARWISWREKKLKKQKELQLEGQDLSSQDLAWIEETNQKEFNMEQDFQNNIELITTTHYSKLAELTKARGEEDIEEAQAVADAKNAIQNAQISNAEAVVGVVKSLAGENKKIMGAAIIAENAVGISKTIISTQTANAQALTLGPLAPAAILANNIQMGISIAASVAAAAQGLSALGKGGAAGGNVPAIPNASAAPPSGEMMSGSFELEGGQAVDPLQAYVVSDDITANQDKLAVIRRRATI